VFREALRVPRHAFSPNCTGSWAPFRFAFRARAAFYLEDLVFWVKVGANKLRHIIVLPVGVFATFLMNHCIGKSSQFATITFFGAGVQAMRQVPESPQSGKGLNL